jgi:hypothetical protein
MPAIAHSHTPRRAGCALYEIDPRSGATIEIFYADGAFAQSIGTRGAGFYWRKRGSPDVPSGPYIVCLDGDATRSVEAIDHPDANDSCRVFVRD